MKQNYNKRDEDAKLNYYKEKYQEVVTNKIDKCESKKIIFKLLEMQKYDGSWSVIDDYRVDSDIRVYYVYYPTYYTTAILMKLDLQFEFENESNEKKALNKGLEFAIGRNLYGHGYDATASLLETLNIYKKAGLYNWIEKNKENDFSNLIYQHILNFKNALKTGQTFSDWNRNFKEEFEKEIDDYELSINNYVWYAAYGSNISKSRFMNYINRCSDTSKPLENKPFTIMHDIYFASKCTSWDSKGVAFLDWENTGKSLGRIYKIKKTQFDELFNMEGSKYNKIINLGELNGTAILTFTSETKRNDINYPSTKYINVINKGLKEIYPDKNELVLNAYLYSRILENSDLKVLGTIRTSTCGIAVGSMFVLGMSKKEIITIIKKLYYLSLIKQDSRSVNQGYLLTDDKSICFTNIKFRDLIDVIIYTR